MHIRNLLQEKGFIQPKAELRLMDVNNYLMKKLNLEERPAKSKNVVVEVWDKHSAELLNLA